MGIRKLLGLKRQVVDKVNTGDIYMYVQYKDSERTRLKELDLIVHNRKGCIGQKPHIGKYGITYRNGLFECVFQSISQSGGGSCSSVTSDVVAEIQQQVPPSIFQKIEGLIVVDNNEGFPITQ